MFEGMMDFTDGIIENASSSEQVFNTFAGTTDASTCAEGFSNAFTCIGNLGINIAATILLIGFFAALVGLFFGVVRVAMSDGGWAAVGAFIIFIIVGIAMYFSPQLLIFFAGLLESFM